MPLPRLALPFLVPAFALLALCACSEPEPAPIAPPASPPQAQATPPAAPGPQAPGGPGLAPDRRPGELHLSPNPPGQVAAEMPPQENVEPSGPPGEPEKTQFDAGDNAIQIAVSAQGFGPEAELQIIELVKGDFGNIQPRVVHIEAIQGRESFHVTAPAALPGKYYALVMEGAFPDASFSGAEQPLSFKGKDLSLSLSAGQQATWMAQLPIGPPPENTLPQEATPPKNLSGGEPPPAPE